MYRYQNWRLKLLKSLKWNLQSYVIKNVDFIGNKRNLNQIFIVLLVQSKSEPTTNASLVLCTTEKDGSWFVELVF